MGTLFEGECIIVTSHHQEKKKMPTKRHKVLNNLFISYYMFCLESVTQHAGLGEISKTSELTESACMQNGVNFGEVAH